MIADQRLKGVRPGFQALREGNEITVFNEDGDFLFALPGDAESKHVNLCACAWQSGFNMGIVRGDTEAKRKFRAALGIA